MDKKHAIVFIFYNYLENKVLIENRVRGQYLEFKKVFPGGKVESNELTDFTKTLMRECAEEFGIKPTRYRIFKKPVLGESGYWLYTCLIIAWAGKIPSMVKDRKSKLEWINIDEYKTDIKSVSRIHKNIKKYIVSHNVVDSLPVLM